MLKSVHVLNVDIIIIMFNHCQLITNHVFKIAIQDNFKILFPFIVKLAQQKIAKYVKVIYALYAI